MNKILEDIIIMMEDIPTYNDLDEEYKENAINTIREWKLYLYEQEEE